MITYFIDIIIPLSVSQTYTYRVPQELSENVEVGKRVIVQFGKNKIYTALVHRKHENAPQKYEAKYILDVLDDRPVVTETQLCFWEWLADYYMSNLGEVMSVALPSGFKLNSESRLVINPAHEGGHDELTDKEFLIYEAVSIQHVISFNDVSKILDQKTIFPIIKSLVQKGIVILEEELIQKYKPKKIYIVSLSEEYNSEIALEYVFSKVSKAQKQEEMLMHFINLTNKIDKIDRRVEKSKLLEASNGISATLNALVKKGILVLSEEVVGRVKDLDDAFKSIPILSSVQEQAHQEIKSLLDADKICYLHGITSSGKTEIYIKIIDEYLNSGKQVLYMLPEIALTTQIITRLNAVFGNRILVYHSKFSNNERVEIWEKVLSYHPSNTEGQLILGPRSSLFLPFKNLGLIVIDEEHENSYKQMEPAPRYHARDASLYLARLMNAQVILGSATPAIESYYNAMEGKYGIVGLFERYKGIELPEIELVDIKKEMKSKLMSGNFSSVLIDNIRLALERKEQIILFQNRRGFAPHLQCVDCGWVPECDNCDVSLTYHKGINTLRCHYCGYQIAIPEKCPQCEGSNLQFKGFGTEKIEEDIGIIFPDAKVFRMDHDTTKSKNAYQQIIGDFEDGKIDILVGTQMITKGLDFDNVSLVGILNADSMLHYPDFRAFERSFQLIEQVSGRAGRYHKRGKVVIQTYDPNHQTLQFVLNHDFSGLYEKEIAERKEFKYPPFYRLIKIVLKHKDYEYLNRASSVFGKNMKTVFGERVLGPEYPLIPRMKSYFQKEMMIKIERNTNLKQVKLAILEQINVIRSDHNFRQLLFSIDVDPV